MLKNKYVFTLLLLYGGTYFAAMRVEFLLFLLHDVTKYFSS